MSTQETYLQEIANAIRTKEGSSEAIPANTFANRILNITTGPDTSDATATADDILAGKIAYSSSGKITGTIETKDSNDLTINGSSIIVPTGYYNSQISKSVNTATQATPSISVSSSGLITASSTQSEGYVNSGTKSSTQQLTTQAAKTITPSSSSQTAVASGRYTTGNIIVAGDSNLVASNIKSGVNIFGVRGTYSGVLPTTYEATDSDFSYSTSTTYSNYGHIQFTLPVTPSSIIAFWLQTRWTPDLSTAASTYTFYPAHSDTLYNNPALGSYSASCFAGHIDNPNRYSIGAIGFDISGRILRLYNTSWDEFFDQNTVRDVLLDYAVITYIA